MTMNKLMDTHFHLDFIEDDKMRTAYIEALCDRSMSVVAQTVLPTKYPILKDWWKTLTPELQSHVVLSLGYHPWYMTSKPDQMGRELEVFKEYLQDTPFIGEIGLDFAPKYMQEDKRLSQEQVLDQLFDIVTTYLSAHPPKKPIVLSIHTVRSADRMIDILESHKLYDQKVIPILHRFNGTSDELMRHIKHGGYISIHPEMLTRKKGRAYIKQIPLDRLLLETDGPDMSDHQFASQDTVDLVASHHEKMVELIQGISNIRGQNIYPAILKNQEVLYSINCL